MIIRGGSAVNGRLSCAWDAATDPAHVGYRVFWGRSSGVYGDSQDVGNVTSVYVSAPLYDSAGTRITYYACAQSYDAGGNLIQTPSNEASGYAIA